MSPGWAWPRYSLTQLGEHVRFYFVEPCFYLRELGPMKIGYLIPSCNTFVLQSSVIAINR
jgi:hypothetical protein